MEIGSTKSKRMCFYENLISVQLLSISYFIFQFIRTCDDCPCCFFIFIFPPLQIFRLTCRARYENVAIYASLIIPLTNLAQSTSFIKSMPVSICISFSMFTRSSVATFPAAPQTKGQPPRPATEVLCLLCQAELLSVYLPYRSPLYYGSVHRIYAFLCANTLYDFFNAQRIRHAGCVAEHEVFYAVCDTCIDDLFNGRNLYFTFYRTSKRCSHIYPKHYALFFAYIDNFFQFCKRLS